MLTMKIYLGKSGTVESLDKDFPIIQGQVNNILLNIFIPTSVLAPNFKTINDNEDTGELTSGTAVKIACKSLERNGTYKLSQNYYLRFVKKLVKDNIEYALFERKLPKEFAFYFGNNTMIINVENIQFANITSYEAKVEKGNFTLTVNKPPRFLAVTKTYKFYFEARDRWILDGHVVNLVRDYGIIVEDGTPKVGDIIYLLVEASENTQINVTTSQQVTYDVLQSNNLDKENETPASEIDTIEAYLNSLSAVLNQKQDKKDDTLKTANNTVVGAINQVNAKTDSNATKISQNKGSISKLNNEVAKLQNLVSTGENYIGTYFFQAENGGDLPTNEELLNFVRSVKGESYNLRNGDSLIVVVAVEKQADKRYKYIYNGTTNEWTEYEILPIELAENGVAGIVYGTFGINSENDIVVDIENGEIKHIYIKDKNGEYNIDLREEALKIQKIINGEIIVGKATKAEKDGIGRNIDSTYLTKAFGASKEFVLENTLSKQFNKMYYWGTKAGKNAFTEQLGDYEIYHVIQPNIPKTIPIYLNDDTLENIIKLNNKNGYKLHLPVVIYGNKNGGQIEFVVRVYLENNPLCSNSIIKTIPTRMESHSLEFEDVFRLIPNNTVYEYTKDSTLKIELEIRADTYADVDLYSTETNPTTFRLAVDSVSLSTAQGIILNSTGTSTVNTMSQDAITKYGKPIGVDLTFDERRVDYNNEAGIIVQSIAEDRRANTENLYYSTAITIPLTTEGDLSMDADENNEKVIIYGANKVMITLVSSQQTNGTITEEELALLQAKDSNYIEVDDGEGHIEKYYYNTNATENGYRVYTHIEDEPNLIIKSFTITLSVRSWVIQSYNINELLSGKVDKVTTGAFVSRLYGIDEEGNQQVYPMSWLPTNNNIPTYHKSNRSVVLETETPQKNLDCANKVYVDDGLSGKVDKIENTGTSTLLYCERNGKTELWSSIYLPHPHAIPMFAPNTSGATLDEEFYSGSIIVATPTQPYQTANKKYVDAQKVREHSVSFENENGGIAGGSSFEILSTKSTALTWDDIYQGLSGFSIDLKSIFFRNTTNFIIQGIENGNVVSTYYSKADFPEIYDTVTEL